MTARAGRTTYVRLGAAALTGALLAAARPPLDLGPLSLVALVPLFLAWRGVRPRFAAGLAFVAGIVYHAFLVSWSWYFGAIAIVPFVAILAAYWAGAGVVLGWFAKYRLRSPWLTAAVWIVAEGLVARVPLGGFSWGEVGYALHDIPAARLIASIGGLPLVSFLVVAANAFVADLVVDVRRGRAGRTALVWGSAGLVTVLVVAPVVALAAPQPHGSGQLRVALVQANDKNRDLTEAEEDDRYLPRRHFELARRIKGPVDLIVLPESSLDEDPRSDAFEHDRLVALARKHDAWVLANAIADAPDGRAINLNLLYGPDGKLVGTYAKRHLVPYGEYVPFRRALEKVISAVDQVPRDFAPGKRRGLFDVAGHPIASIICFESAFGYQVRPLAHAGAEAIVLSTNNRSYRRSANSAQHLAIGQLRAAETGRPVVQAAISGISAVIDRDGNIHHATELFDTALIESTVGLTAGQTLYVRYGEWVLWGSVVAVLAAAVVVFARRRASVDSAPEAEQSAPIDDDVLEPSGEPA